LTRKFYQVKLCSLAFFAENERMGAEEVPLNMQLAMLLTAFLCVLIGMYPRVLFHVLPFSPVRYQSYTPSHMIGIIQLFLLAGTVFMAAKTVLSPKEGIVLDFDFFYRMTCRGIVWLCTAPLNGLRLGVQAFFARKVGVMAKLSRNPISMPSIVIQYVYLKALQVLKHGPTSPEEGQRELEEMESRLAEIRNMAYDENAYRGPMGLGVLVAMIFLFLYGVIYFLAS
jgi:multicomponent Na+:H+ antiporter subunit D